MNKKRPININPFSIQLPITALVSIFHRLAGILVFLLIPMLLWGLDHSLRSQEGFWEVKQSLQSPLWKMLAWGLFCGLTFHLLAGFRHLLMDIHIGDSRRAGRMSAVLVIILALVIALGAAFWLWR